MPPRIPVLSCLRASTASSTTQFSLPIRTFASTTILQAKTIERSKKHASRDPYIVAQRARKKAANLTRRSELEEARVGNLGNPVRGIPTPFVQSLETGKPAETDQSNSVFDDKAHLNYAFDAEVVAKQLEKSQQIAVPLSALSSLEKPKDRLPWGLSKTYDTQSETEAIGMTAEEIEAQTKKDHERAVEAIARITALENGSSKDRMRVNISRCVQTFGRHNTDKVFPPKAPTLRSSDGKEQHPARPDTNVAAAAKRAGPDTGSSEVQIAILTAKIKTLADFLETRGKGDKHNKRNLRLLVHRRQKLLQYLRRKERGGPRWQHCIETLGLTEGTWRGEISL